MTFVATCTGGGNGGTASVTSVDLTLPGSAVAGHVLVWGTCQNGSNTLTPPAGAIILSGPHDSVAANDRCYLVGKVLTAADITAGLVNAGVWNGSARVAAAGDVFSDVTLDNFKIGAFTTGAATTVVAMPAVASVYDNSEIILYVSGRIASGTPSNITFPSGYTKDQEAKSATAGINVASSIAHLTTVGARGSYAGSNGSQTSQTYIAESLALAPYNEHGWGIPVR